MAATVSIDLRFRALDVTLELDPERSPVTVLLGPSGAGKTTLIRCLAGLERPAAGSRIAVGGEVWCDDRTWVPARQRGLGYLFQDHALFPHLDVDANVAFGLHGLSKADRADRVAAALRMAAASHLAGRRVDQLSGGEAQRVALARALAPQPRLLLLDEPLTGLDRPTRAQLQGELRRLLVAARIPAVVVTHDRNEALAIGDSVAVLIDGRLRQHGPVAEVFSQPADADVAEAVETENVLPGRVVGSGEGVVRLRIGSGELVAAGSAAIGADVLACLRAEDVVLTERPAAGRESPRNQLPCLVRSVSPLGPVVRVDLDAGFPLAAYITRPAAEELRIAPGEGLLAVVKATAVHLVRRD